jgi:hypothetical protein
MYRLKLSSATAEQIDRIQSPLRKVIAKKAHITAAHTNVLFGGYMGCGWKKWSDEAGIKRLRILQLAWQEHDSVFGKAIMQGAVWQMQIGSGASDLALESRYAGEVRPSVENTSALALNECL